MALWAAGGRRSVLGVPEVEAGAAEVMTEAEFDVGPLTQKLTEMLTDEAGMMKRAQAALACGVPDATTRLVAMVEDLANT